MLGPVHTNPFSNEKGAVAPFLKRFVSTLIVFVSLSPVHTKTPYPLLYPQCACSNELDACVFQYIGLLNWREIETTW